MTVWMKLVTVPLFVPASSFQSWLRGGVQETHIICILHVFLYGACHIPSCHCLGPLRVLISLILTVHAARQLETPQLLLEPLPRGHQRHSACTNKTIAVSRTC